MNSKTTDSFWDGYNNLPIEIKKRAKEVFKRFINNPYHPSLYFKRIHSTRSIYSVRISKDYRAVCVMHNSDIIWFWIGSHSDYNQLLKKHKII